MRLARRSLLAAAASAAVLPPRRSRAQAKPVIRIGVMNDMSGPYRDVNGPTGVACAKQAVQEFAAGAFDVDVLSADHQNKPDVAVSLAREWFDQRGVDIIIDVAATSCALALAGDVQGEEQGADPDQHREFRHHRQRVHAELDPLGVRHLHGGEIDRRRDGEGRRRHVVFHYAELRVRRGHPARHDALRRGGRRQGARRAAVSVPGDHRLLGLPGQGAGLGGEDPRHLRRRCRSDQHRQAGARVRPDAQDEPGGAGRLHDRYPLDRHRDGGRNAAVGDLLLGPQRPHAQLPEAHPAQGRRCGRTWRRRGIIPARCTI